MKDVQGQGRDRSLEGEVGPDPDGETRIAAEVEVGAVKGSSDGSQCMGEILEPPNHDVAVQLLTNADTTLHDSIHRMPDAGLSLIDIGITLEFGELKPSSFARRQGCSGLLDDIRQHLLPQQSASKYILL
ncbi:hypothetical protein GQ600_27206 [Phytophthora cactorum]|nr:hypothetical protein GQ600_27206 [Phytophthora cactorum]